MCLWSQNAPLGWLLSSLLMVPPTLASSCSCRAMVEARSRWLHTAAGAWLKPGPQCKHTKREERKFALGLLVGYLRGSCENLWVIIVFWCCQPLAETEDLFKPFQFYHHGCRNKQLPRDTYCSLSLGEISFNWANLLSPFYVQNILLDAVFSATQIWTVD